MRHVKLLSFSLACVTSVGCNTEPPPPSGGTEDDSTTASLDADTGGGPTSSSGPGTSSGSSGVDASTSTASTASTGEDTTMSATGALCDDRDCTDPPAAACHDPFTVSAPAAVGACVDGDCQYETELLDCAFGCDEAQCSCEAAAVCTDGEPRAATAWFIADSVQQPRIASLGCSQVVAARATVGGVQMLRLWIVDHQGAVLDETVLDVPPGRLDVAAHHGVIALTRDDDDQIFAALFDLDLDPLATNIPLSPPDRQLRSPAIAPTSDGTGFVTVYYGEDGVGGFGLFAQTIDRDGNLVGAEHVLGVASGQLGSGCYTFPDVATGAGGTMAVWSHCESGTRSVYAVPLDASGAAAAAPGLVALASEGSIAPSRVAVTGTGTQFAVTYNNDRLDNPGNSGDVYVAVLDAAAQVVAGPENATQGTWGGGKFWPEIVAGPNALVLSWYSPLAAPGDRRVLLSAVDPATATRIGPLIDASIETGTDPFFHLYPSPFVGPEGFGVIFPSASELWMVGRHCPAARAE
jgi:hypothetical protein